MSKLHCCMCFCCIHQIKISKSEKLLGLKDTPTYMMLSNSESLAILLFEYSLYS